MYFHYIAQTHPARTSIDDDMIGASFLPNRPRPDHDRMHVTSSYVSRKREERAVSCSLQAFSGAFIIFHAPLYLMEILTYPVAPSFLSSLGFRPVIACARVPT